MPSTFDHLLSRLAEAFGAVGLPYRVIGGQAVLLYGEPRVTQDIGVTIGAAPDRLPDVLAALTGVGFQALVDTAFVEETLVLLCEDSDSRIRVDVIFSFSGYEQEALRRAARRHRGHRRALRLAGGSADPQGRRRATSRMRAACCSKRTR
ncbi:MAG: hypothetical protein ABJF88_09085 [Rhodothermales bacterium]